MNPKETERYLRNLLDRVWNQGDLGAARELVRDNVVLNCPHCNRLVGARAYLEYVALVLGMYPDLHVDIHELIVFEQRVALRYTWSGAFAGGPTPFGPAPAGRRVSVQGVALYHLLEDQIVAGWMSEDWLGMYQQLGVLPEHLPRDSAARAA